MIWIKIKWATEDNSCHGASKEPINPLWDIHWFFWCTLMRLILIGLLILIGIIQKEREDTQPRLSRLHQ